MGKGQINFRIEDSLLEAIKGKAKNEGIPYTLWISRQCRIGLGLDSPVPSNVYQSSSAIDEAMLDKRISEILDPRLNEQEKKLTDLEAVITNLEKQWAANPLLKKEEVISHFREKEIVPILSKVESFERAIATLEAAINEITNQKTANESDLEVDSIPDYSPIFTESEPESTFDLEEKIRDYIAKHKGKAILTSNLFKGLKITGKKEAKKEAKKILVALGCTEIKVQLNSGGIHPKWQFP